MSSFCLAAVLIASLAFSGAARADELAARKVLDALVAGPEEQRAGEVAALAEFGEQVILEVVEAWRVGKVFTYTAPGAASPIALLDVGDGIYQAIASGNRLTPDPAGTLEVSRPDRSLRRDLKRLVDIIDLASANEATRIEAALKLGKSQNPEYLPELRERLPKQTSAKTARAFEEAIAISQLVNGTPQEVSSAIQTLGRLKSLPAKGFLETLLRSLEGSGDPNNLQQVAAAKVAIKEIMAHQQVMENYGTAFRGLSLGSVLLVVCFGLAITFGLMGVINMAHGEFMAIGGYTVYLVQNFFARHFGDSSTAFEWYFVAAIPCAFLAAALAGALLERGVIRFLYRRPLESLLATWGVSMILQQLFRLQFGAANVQVASPHWLAGNIDVSGVAMSYSRLFVIGFAVAIMVLTWLLLTKTRLGLHVRATMQNRTMAASLGVPSARVNMMTFAFGSGLAGLAGAFLSQIGNVGPSMGQAYIVDSFMVVVIGGVGNLIGAAVSSIGIGSTDQILQSAYDDPVMGKITVLVAIILFLQWRPGGLFPSRSRSLED
jgi:urea transport system permease protein